MSFRLGLLLAIWVTPLLASAHSGSEITNILSWAFMLAALVSASFAMVRRDRVTDVALSLPN